MAAMAAARTGLAPHPSLAHVALFHAHHGKCPSTKEATPNTASPMRKAGACPRGPGPAAQEREAAEREGEAVENPLRASVRVPQLLPYRGSAMLTMMVSATAIKAAAHSRKRAGRPRLTGASGPPASPTQRARSLPALV
jgi:hypothetical protein